MRVISNKKLVEFGFLHSDADGPLQAWRKSIESRDFAGFADLKSVFRSVDKVGDFFVFNIGGNSIVWSPSSASSEVKYSFGRS